MNPISLDEIERARERIAKLTLRSPLVRLGVDDAPAALTVNNIRTGHTFSCGHVNVDVPKETMRATPAQAEAAGFLLHHLCGCFLGFHRVIDGDLRLRFSAHALDEVLIYLVVSPDLGACLGELPLLFRAFFTHEREQVVPVCMQEERLLAVYAAKNSPPTLVQGGPEGINGIAGYDAIRAIIAVGAMILIVPLRVTTCGGKSVSKDTLRLTLPRS